MPGSGAETGRRRERASVCPAFFPGPKTGDLGHPLFSTVAGRKRPRGWGTEDQRRRDGPKVGGIFVRLAFFPGPKTGDLGHPLFSTVAGRRRPRGWGTEDQRRRDGPKVGGI